MNSPTEHKTFPKWEKKEKKDKGYQVFEADSTPEKEEVASPKTKSRTKPSFKISKKEKTPSKAEKEKEAKREKKERKKLMRKKQQQQQQQSPYTPAPEQPLRPVIGVPLEQAVRRSKSHDGIELPAFFRECVDYLEAQGLSVEGIYRISPVKSKVQTLVHAINMGRSVELADYDPCVIAGLIKLFLRELPEPVLTVPLGANFEEASALRDPQAKLRAFKQLLELLPRPNFLLLAWMVLHATHVISRAAENKMTHQNVSIVLSPTMQISHRVLNVFLTYPNDLFSEVQFRRYTPPLQPSSAGGGRVELPDSAAAVEEELAKQESLLATLHEEIKEGDTNPEKEAQIWEVQRFCTQLKRKRHLLVSLVSRAAIEAELAKQEAVLARLHGQLEKASSGGAVGQETHDELWEVQRTVTMLKRKLKAAQRPAAPSGGGPGEGPGGDLGSGAAGLGSEEDVMLNLTLRKVDKVPADPLIAQASKGGAKEAKMQTPRKSSVELPKKAAVDLPREAPVDVPREAPVDVPREAPVDVPREAPVDVPREPPVDVPREAPVDVPREAPVDVPREAAIDVPEETPIDVPKESPVEVPKEPAVPQETAIDIPEEVAVASVKEAPLPEETFADVAETAVDVPETSPASVPKQGGAEVPKALDEAAVVSAEGEEKAEGVAMRRRSSGAVMGDHARVSASASSRSSSSVVAHSSIMDEEEGEECAEEGEGSGMRSSGEHRVTSGGTEDISPIVRNAETHRRSHLLSFGPMISLDDFVERGCLAAGESDLLLGDEDEDEELRSAFDDYRRLRYEEEELCAIGNDLTTRIQSERREIARLQQEIARLKGSEAAGGLASITECDFSGGDLSSDDWDSSEEEAEEEELVKQFQQLVHDNERLGRENQALVENIQRERMLCAEIKVQMRMMTT